MCPMPHLVSIWSVAFERELRASSKASDYAKDLESQLRETEKQLKEALSIKSKVKELRNSRSESRVHALKLALRLRDRVTSDAMDADERKSVEDYQPHITDTAPGKSGTEILNVSIDHRRALQANSELRRELSMKQDELSSLGRNLVNERQVSAQKLKSLTTILRQAQDGWAREREEILREKKM